jgi:hypothetical protein
LGGHTRRAFELLGYFQGLGVLTAAPGAFAMARYLSRPGAAEMAAVAAEGPVAAAETPVTTHEEPVAATAAEPVAARDEQAAAVPRATTAGATGVTYRRRRGLSRLRRR